MSEDLDKLEKKVLSKKWGEKTPIPDYEIYKEEGQISKKLGWQEKGRGKRFVNDHGSKFVWLFLILFVIGGVWYYFNFSKPVFDPGRVNVFIAGPQKISSGQKAAFKVSYRNDSDVVLRDVKLLFEWPEGTLFENSENESVKIEREVGILMPNQEKVVIFEGRIYGDKNSLKKIKADLSYTPSELGKSFNAYEEFDVSVETIPIFLNVSLPEQVVSSKEVEIKVEYINQSDASFSNMEIRAEYPANFEFVSSDLNPAVSNNVWQLGSVQGGEEGSLIIRGNFNGQEGEKQLIYVDIGQVNLAGDEFASFANSISETQIASSALLVFQTVNGSRDASVELGEALTYKINYKNTTNTQISNVVILAQIDDSLIDVKTLSISFGSFDGRTNSIIWNQSGVPELAVLDPKEEGTVTFSVRSKKDFVPKSASDKNLKIVSNAKIASGAVVSDLSGLPVEDQDNMEVKINTDLKFRASGYYSDGPIRNTGPIPPKVGNETSYAISWQITNTTNDVKDVVVTATVPPNVDWTGVIDPVDAGVTFDKTKGLITWKPGIVFAGSGYVIPSQRVDFQLSFLPALVHVGSTINLISTISFEGVDVFTGEKIEKKLKGIDSSLNGFLKNDIAKVIQ